MLFTDVKFREDISNSIRVMEQTQNYEMLTDGLTEGRTDTQNFGWYNIIPCPFFFFWGGGGGEHKNLGPDPAYCEIYQQKLRS